MKLCPKCQKQFSDDANFCPVDAARLVPLEGPSSTAPADPLTERFQLGDKLGGGRTGAVHLALDKQGGGAAVVKLISPEVVALPGVSQRLERELKQLERVHSAGVAHVLASGRRGEDWWVATELLEGGQTLADAITARGPIPLDFAAHLIEVIGEALIEAAQVGVVHRDLAPKNVLFAGNDIKLINFSVPVPTAERVAGVPEFVAPEQVEGKPVDQRSNLYSLGALYYFVLTGQTVHAGAAHEVHRAHVGASIRTPSSLAPVPGPVEAVIMRALDRSPTKRFLTVRQFVDEVGRVARGEVDPRTTQPMGKAGRPKAELVQTLLGVRGSAANAAIAAAVAASQKPAAAGAGAGAGAGGAAVAAAAPAAGPVPAAPVLPPGVELPGGIPPAIAALAGSPVNPAATMQGMGGGSPGSAHPASVIVAQQEPPGYEAPAQAAALPERSPWAPPPTAPPVAELQPSQTAAGMIASAAHAHAPAPQAQVSPQPQPQPVAPQAPAQPAAPPPVIAPPQVSNAPNPSAKQQGEKKGAFRETMWFKKGDLDAQAAVAAAEERAKTGKDAAGDQADSLPMDERYKDDGSISRGDKEKYSLRTGSTQAMSALKDPRAQSSTKVSEDTLIEEMKAGRGKIFALIGLGLALLIAIILFVAL